MSLRHKRRDRKVLVHRVPRLLPEPVLRRRLIAREQEPSRACILLNFLRRNLLTASASHYSLVTKIYLRAVWKPCTDDEGTLQELLLEVGIEVARGSLARVRSEWAHAVARSELTFTV